MALLNVPRSECLHMKNHIEIKIGELNFGEFIVICQIRQSFPTPMFPSIRYNLRHYTIVFAFLYNHYKCTNSLMASFSNDDYSKVGFVGWEAILFLINQVLPYLMI